MTDERIITTAEGGPSTATTSPAQGESILDVRNLHKEYLTESGPHVAIERVSFSVRKGERVSVVGPSGAGKTTLLRCISGLQPITSGTVSFRGKLVEAPPQGLAIVFQDYARSLFPWMSVESNVRLPLKYLSLPVERQNALVREALVSVGLERFGDRYPGQLSGGMQQRVAIARALAYQPQLLLMDEPFASVDAQTRLSLEDLTLRICKSYGITLILITHDIDEAIYMGNQLLVLSSSPAVVRKFMAVDLPDTRDQVETKLLRRFGEIRAEVYGLINPPAAAATAAPVNG
jgi:NitT/TauT family transport system ATP-binding protein